MSTHDEIHYPEFHCHNEREPGLNKELLSVLAALAVFWLLVGYGISLIVPLYF